MTSVPRVQGKFFELDGRRFLVKGVAYGTFAPDANGLQFPSDDRVDSDFAMMAAAGLNTVRTYTVPPLSLLDAAARHGLRVIAGIPWSQHIAFLDDPALTREVRRTVVEAAGRVAAHPATLMVAVGNEIPPAVVRWHGHVRVERFLRALYDDVKSVAPDTLVTYVNFPPTEHLDVSHFDVCAFNVYLHRDADLRAYLVRLQHLAGNKPLLLAEAGADSIREGLEGQARITAMHLRTSFAEGAAGAVAFSWTDQWWRGGQTVEDWAFGLVDAARQPKLALAAVAQAFAAAPFSADERAAWPTVSVVICAYNAADTIRDCLTSLQALTYPRAEVIVVDDGSRDDTASIAASFSGVRLISIPNGGLSAARNVGLAHATGEIVAYTDADVRVDPDWLTYLVQPFVTSDVAAAGGPNVVPADDPWVAQCVARAPGGPTQVLLDDRVAEHVPGCNLAVSRDALLSIGGFNPVYLRAGDDVDVCWRLQAKGYSIGFAPSALVWHHHRGSVKAYWRQQAGYGEGETWLDAHHPEKFVRGQMLWRGRIYSPLPFVRALAGRRVNTGVWGTAAFPSVYSTDVHPLKFLPHAPAWMLTATALLLSGALGLLVRPGDASILLLAAGFAGWAVTAVRCMMFAAASDLSGLPAIGGHSAGRSRLQYRSLIAWLHLMQPVARLYGRARGLLSPPDVATSTHVTTVPWAVPSPSMWSTAAAARLQVGGTAEWSFWSEAWTSQSSLLTALVATLRASRPARRVDTDDGWQTDRDLSIAVGRWGWLHVRALIEEHAEGRCLCRAAARLQPNVRGILRIALLSAALVGASSAAIALRWPWVTATAAVAAVALFVSVAWQTARAVAVLDRALARVTIQAGMVPLPGRSAGPLLTWRPSPVLHKGQAALVFGMVAAGAILGGRALSRDFTLRPADAPLTRPQVTAPAGQGARPPVPRPVASGRDAGAVTPPRPVGAIAPARARQQPRSQVRDRVAEPPAQRRKVRRTL